MEGKLSFYYVDESRFDNIIFLYREVSLKFRFIKIMTTHVSEVLSDRNLSRGTLQALSSSALLQDATNKFSKGIRKKSTSKSPLYKFQRHYISYVVIFHLSGKTLTVLVTNFWLMCFSYCRSFNICIFTEILRRFQHESR